MSKHSKGEGAKGSSGQNARGRRIAEAFEIKPGGGKHSETKGTSAASKLIALAKLARGQKGKS